MAKSDYDYDIIEHSGRNCLLINDLNKGGMSVTNNIEEVIEEIKVKEGIDPARLMIIYCDSDGFWDGWDHESQTFVILRGKGDWKAAIANYIEIQIKYK